MRKFLKDFSRSEIREITISYSQIPVVSKCSEMYEISANMLKKLLYKSISDCIVENDVVIAVLNSIRKRAILHSNEGKYASLYCFNEKCKKLISSRKAFKFSDEEAVWITRSYASSPLSKEQFCAENALTCSLLDRTLVYVTCNCMVEDDIVEILEDKAFYSNRYNDVIVYELFEKIAKARKRFRQMHS